MFIVCFVFYCSNFILSKEIDKNFKDNNTFDTQDNYSLSNSAKNASSFINQTKYKDLLNERFIASNFSTDWIKYKENFNLQQIITFEINPNNTYRFYENIKKVPQKLKGFYSIIGDTKMTFIITDPNGKDIYLNDRQKDVLFYPIVTEPGQYVLEFINNNVNLSN